jgi:DNA-binding IclR family transcriptional regulator
VTDPARPGPLGIVQPWSGSAGERGRRLASGSGAPGGSGDIQAVQRVGQLLALFTVHRPRLTVAEAASLVGLNRSTVSRYFGSLVLAGVLERARDEQAAYQPGPLLMQLGAVAQGQRRVLDLAPSHMRRLSRETGLTTVLSLLGPTGPVVSLVSEVGTRDILITVRVGTTLEMDSAQGQLFLRFSADREAIGSYWDGLDPTTRRRVEAGVAEVGATGTARAMAPMGMAILAAPVFDDHDIAATIAVVGTPEGDAGIATALRRTAFGISEELGGTEVWRSLLPGTDESGPRCAAGGS